MIFSTPTAAGYAYWEGPGTFPPTGSYRKPRGQAVRGMFPPEAFAAVLPSDAVRTGEGKQARGVVAVTGAAVAGFAQDAVKAMESSPGYFAAWYSAKSILLVGVTAFAAFLLGKESGRKKKRRRK